MTSFSQTSRNSTTFDQGLSTGNLTHLLTDALDFILVGENEDETLILWGATSFSEGARQTTSYTGGSRQATSFTGGSRNTTAFNSVARN